MKNWRTSCIPNNKYLRIYTALAALVLAVSLLNLCLGAEKVPLGRSRSYENRICRVKFRGKAIYTRKAGAAAPASRFSVYLRGIPHRCSLDEMKNYAVK